MSRTLPLTAFEEYMLADDRPTHPMNFFLRLRFSGRLDHPAMEAAWRKALGRHSLLCVVAEQPAKGCPQWVERSELPPLSWSDSDLQASPIDVRREPGVRAWGIERPATTDFWLQFHHACCDGLGSLTFLEDLLVAYAQALGTADRRTNLRPLHDNLLAGRGRFGMTPRKWLRVLHRQAVGLIGVWEFLRHKPTPLVPGTSQHITEPLAGDYPAIETVRLSAEELQALRNSARRQEVTLNDLLIRELLLALFDWRRRQGCPSDQDWLRVAIPMSLRTMAQARLPAANVVSMVFIDRRSGDGTDPAGLLQGIHDQMDKIKRLGLGLTFVISLWAGRFLPGGMAARVSPAHCQSTAVLTNLGELFKRTPLERRHGRIVLGDATLDAVETVAPLRPHTCAAFSVFVYANQLCVTLHYDPRALRREQAKDLLDTFLRQMQSPVAEVPVAASCEQETVTSCQPS